MVKDYSNLVIKQDLPESHPSVLALLDEFYTPEILVVFRFVNQFTNNVEIIRDDGKLVQHYFTIKQVNLFLTPATKSRFIQSFDRTTYQSKINDTITQLPYFNLEMNERFKQVQKLPSLLLKAYRKGLTINNLGIQINKICFLFTFIICCFLVKDYTSNSNVYFYTGDFYPIIRMLIIFQITINLLGYLYWLRIGYEIYWKILLK